MLTSGLASGVLSGLTGGVRSGPIGRLINAVDCCPWGSAAGRRPGFEFRAASPLRSRPLYTPEQRRRRDASPWTLVQGVLAPLQFGVFLVSLGSCCATC